jgi:hypothetical protein
VLAWQVQLVVLMEPMMMLLVVVALQALAPSPHVPDTPTAPTATPLYTSSLKHRVYICGYVDLIS